jgi:hypothetical protein
MPVSGPVLGFVASGPTGVRPILGIPGAATLGSPVLPGAGFAGIAFSASRDYALALVARGRQAVLLRNLTSSIDAVQLPVAPGAVRMAISPSGASAALYYPDTRSVTVLAGLPNAPAVSWKLESQDLAGGLLALAVSDDAGAILAAAAGQPSAVWLLAADGSSRILSQVAAAPSLAFVAGGHDVLIADAGLNTVTLVRDATGQALVRQIGAQAEGVSRPVAVSASADGLHAIVANQDPAGVVVLSLDGEPPLALPCQCAVTGLEPLADGTTFRLSDPGEGPVWLLDSASSPPRVVFVPNPRLARPGLLRVPVPVRPGGER